MKVTTIGQTSGNGQETRSEATSNCQLSIVNCQLERFAAIDFETANGKRSSICSVGIVLVERGQIVDSIYQLIRPYPDYYTHWTTEVHGLTKRDTADAPDFGTAWPFIARRIEGLFDLSPAAIVERFGLKNPIFEATASYGHFGNRPYKKEVTVYENGCPTTREVEFFSWEKLDEVDRLRREFNL